MPQLCKSKVMSPIPGVALIFQEQQILSKLLPLLVFNFCFESLGTSYVGMYTHVWVCVCSTKHVEDIYYHICVSCCEVIQDVLSMIFLSQGSQLKSEYSFEDI